MLLVDDHLMVRVGLAGVLERTHRCSVVAEAATGGSAIQQYRELRPDVTLLDQWLPDISGDEVMARLRQEDPDARVIMLSIDEGEDDIHRALKAGARGYLCKSIQSDELLLAIETVLQGETYVARALRERFAERRRRPELSPRENEVLHRIVLGQTNKAIARELGLSEVTVKVYVGRILGKLGVEDRTQAATAAIARGIVHVV